MTELMVLALVVTGKRFSASGQHWKQTNVILSEVWRQSGERSEAKGSAKRSRRTCGLDGVVARIGATGGRSRSVAKRKAAKKNGKLGGRPKKRVA